jgi:aminoglycoside phosphotransferase (APT) family kinase protein
MSDRVEVKGIRSETVAQWFATHVPGVRLPLRFSVIAGGHSNLTYRVDDASGRAYVLRRPPLGAILATAHDMPREHRIQAGVAKAGIPVPPMLGLCTDESVNDAAFYVMGFVDGAVLASAAEAERAFPKPADRHALGLHVADVLADLHAVDPDAVGLGDLGKKEDYIARQLRRWKTQWESSKTRELPAMDRVHAVLAANIPEQRGASIVHGDYRLGNMISGANARIAAVLDWELCTLGDPLADVAFLLNNWAEPGETSPTQRGAALSPSLAGGFPSRAELVARYSARSGRDVSRIDYYRAFQFWRLAAIVEGVMARYLKGVMAGSADVDAFRKQIDGLAEAALELARQL